MNDSFMDRYGYYQIGDLKTYIGYEVMDYYNENPKPYSYIYNDDFFSQYNWTIEPSESLDELYGKRALELRKQYDYIALHYSGGHDSTNMLRAFLDNNIYPDEIFVYYSRYDTVSNQYLELKDYTWKKVKDIEKQYPQIKVRKLDYSDIIFEWSNIIKRQNLNLEPVYLLCPRLSVNRLVLDVLYEYIDDWKNILKDKKTLCTLQGFDIPRFTYKFKEQQLVHNFTDQDVLGCMTPMRQITNKKNRDILELFYWAPTDTCAKIMIKQCHLAKKFFLKETNGKLLNLLNIKHLGYVDKQNVEYKFTLHTNQSFRKIIYPKIFKGSEKFYNKKVKAVFWGNKDQWYYNSNHPNSKICIFLYFTTIRNTGNLFLKTTTSTMDIYQSKARTT